MGNLTNLKKKKKNRKCNLSTLIAGNQARFDTDFQLTLCCKAASLGKRLCRDIVCASLESLTKFLFHLRYDFEREN